jgi:hypothetical protein
MITRFLIALIIVAGLLGVPAMQANCPVKVSKKSSCPCCQTSAARSCCGTAMESRCGSIPLQQEDRASQSDIKPAITPSLFSVGEITFFAPAAYFPSVVENVREIPSPPLLELNCIRLI